MKSGCGSVPGEQWCIRGKQQGDVCCSDTCSICTGPKCSGNCCGGYISQQGFCKDSNDVSCIIPATTATNNTSYPLLHQVQLSDGPWCVLGKRQRQICCAANCSVCTGPDCSGMCCGRQIAQQGLCKQKEDVSCIIPEDDGLGHDTSPAASTKWCSHGKQHGQACCEASCAVCTGLTCSGACCGSYIARQGACRDALDVSCVIPDELAGYEQAPLRVDLDTTVDVDIDLSKVEATSPDHQFRTAALPDLDGPIDPWCALGTRVGQVCCAKSCKVCGGPRCTGSCCGGHIAKRGLCANHSEVSCLIPDGFL